MKKRTKLSLVALAVLLISNFAIFLPGGSLIVWTVPPLGSVYDKIAGLFGYELQCFDMHGGFKCKIAESLASRQKRTELAAQTRQDRVQESYGCKSDADCFLTPKGGCITGNKSRSIFNGVPQDLRATPHKCVCQNGPVFYGCAPAAQLN